MMIKAPTPTAANGTSLAALRQGNVQTAPAVTVGLDTVAGFEALQRMAKLFTSSQIVPQTFRNLPDACIALNMAIRLGADPMMVMQSLYIVHGKPAWSASFLIATFNRCGRYASVKYRMSGKPGTDDFGCTAYTTELASGELVEGPLITIGLAKKEGWYGKAGSKWQTMPELMLRYRAASWMIRTVAPEISMGIKTQEEVQDTWDMEQTGDGQYTVTQADLREAEEAASAPAGEVKAEVVVDSKPKAETAPKRAPSAARIRTDLCTFPGSVDGKPSHEVCGKCLKRDCTIRAK